MARLRVVDPTGIYHVFTRGNHRRTIFDDLEHFERYVSLVDRTVRRWQWVVLDYCVMFNHFHLVIQLTDGGLSEGMKELNGGYSRWRNRVHGMTGTGHSVRNRFGSNLVETDAYLLELFRYVALNPVRHGFTTRPEEWPWSGFHALAGYEHPRSFHRADVALRYFGEEPLSARRRYHAHVAEGLVAPGLVLSSDVEVRGAASALRD